MVEYLGIEAVANAIQQSKLTKMVIVRVSDGKRSVPVFENLHCDSNGKLVESFKKWAYNILQSNPTNNTTYEILLGNEKSLDTSDEEAQEFASEEYRPKLKTSGRGVSKMRFLFQLSNGNPYINAPQLQSLNGNYVSKDEISNIVAEALAKQAEKDKQDKLLKRIDELEQIINGENEDYEEDENIDKVDRIMDRGERILDRLENWGKKKKVVEEKKEVEKAEAVNGVSDISKATGRDIKANINKAITTLYKHNKDLDLDLLKLAEIAEKNALYFKTMIKSLRELELD
jgi:hypothetical protein